MDRMNEKELVQGVLNGSRASQRYLFDNYAPHMMTICNRYSKSPDQAADMLQEGFITVFQKLNQFDGTGSLEGWIRRVMITSALSVLRKEKKFKFTEEVNNAIGVESDITDAISQMSFQELTELIQKMPNGYRTVFNLFAIEGYSHKEIADQLVISESTSKTQYRKAKIYLQNLISENE